VLIRSNRVTLWYRDECVNALQNLRLKIHFDGGFNREMTDFLSSHKNKPRRAKVWAVVNVGMGIKKLKKRFDRETSKDNVDASTSVS
jgi:hypothetical protein